VAGEIAKEGGEVLFVHELHRVAGAREADFDAAFREGWMPELARGGEARLLWYLRQAHGTGPAYHVVTVTAVRDGAAWQQLAQRLARGDLAGWLTDVDAMRHGSEAKVLVPVPWSPLQEVDLAQVPAGGAEHPPSLYMEDTAWPYPGGLSAYLEAAGSLYLATLEASRAAGRAILELEAAFQPAFGTHSPREVVLWQKVVDHQALLRLLSHEVPDQARAPGTWMHEALKVRDRWESRLLRSAPWSPWH
jgi:hypothetical protein